MKQIVIISGKGGTGKTILTASFAALAQNKVIVDCDVDAADLYLLLHPHIKERHQFSGGKKATIDRERCTECAKCIQVCRFEAIKIVEDLELKVKSFSIDLISCEGCKVCFYLCPQEAIRMEENISGEWYLSDTKYGPMVHARLGIAEENSGKLVTVVRQNAKLVAEKNRLDLIIIDGPPGIGCPVIASLASVDLALVVAEPTLSGIHDMERAIGMARHFGVKVVCVINKYDINLENTGRIENWCQKETLPVLGKIPFDPIVTKALIQGIPVVEYFPNTISKEIKYIWQGLLEVL